MASLYAAYLRRRTRVETKQMIRAARRSKGIDMSANPDDTVYTRSDGGRYQGKGEHEPELTPFRDTGCVYTVTEARNMATTRPAYHCGAEECCEGRRYPQCMESVKAGSTSPGQQYSHYDDDAAGQSAYPYTD